MTLPPASSPVARFGRGCLGLLLLAAVLAAASHQILTPRVTNPELRLGVALVASLFLATGLASFWSLAQGHGRGQGSRSGLLRRASTGEPAPDGGAIVASGRVRALAAPLLAPLSATPCVAYVYRMFVHVRGGRGGRGQRPVYWGYASRPFAVDGPSGRCRVLAVPHLLHEATRHGGAEHVERARQLVKTTAFEPVSGDGFGVVGTVFTMAREVFTDDDGQALQHWKRAGDETDPAQLFLEETVLPVGAEASIHGMWSAERGAIVASGDVAVAAGVSATLGPPENLAPVLPPSTGGSFATATISTVLGAAIVWFAFEILPTLL